MTKVTLREVCRTILDVKAEDWADYCAQYESNPMLSYSEFENILITSELLVDERSIATKWRIAVGKGILKPISSSSRSRMSLVNIPAIESVAGTVLPRRARTHTRTHTSPSPGAQARADLNARDYTREEPDASCTSGKVETVTVSYEEGSE